MRENEFNAKLAELTKQIAKVQGQVGKLAAARSYESRRAAVYRGALKRLLDYMVAARELDTARDFLDDEFCSYCDDATNVEIIAAKAVLEDPRYL